MSATMPSLSVIVPTFNMSAHLPGMQWALREAGLFDLANEILFVDDGSSDETPLILAEFQATAPKTRVLTLDSNRGRYAARLAGARAARTDLLLFLDTRVRPSADFKQALLRRLDHGCAAVTVRINVATSVFNLYWDRTHAFIFQKNIRDGERGIWLTPENFDAYVTGTTGFLCRREDFLAACASFGDRDLRSDDTYLMKEIAGRKPIFVRSDWFVWWEPRQSLGAFLGRLWDRGPGFAEYHVFTRRGLYFYLLVFAYGVLGVVAVTTWLKPAWGGSALALLACAVLATAAAFAKGPREFIRLAPLHLAVCATAGLSALRGVIVCGRKQGRAAG